jgi:hypothetical protein
MLIFSVSTIGFRLLRHMQRIYVSCISSCSSLCVSFTAIGQKISSYEESSAIEKTQYMR